tara:strand:+ start:653 stop:919 length:267 start_codon:yes stop_codon:yes gene_type:complete
MKKNKKMNIKRVKSHNGQVISVEEVVGKDFTEMKEDEDYMDCIKENGYVFYEGSESDMFIDLYYKERVGFYMDIIYNEYEKKVLEYVL